MKRIPRYIALAEVNMDFSPREVKSFDFLMNEGHSILDVARYLEEKQIGNLYLVSGPNVL